MSNGVMIDPTCWYMRLESYTKAQWPQWNATNKHFEPGNTIAVCPAYAHLPSPYYDDESGSYGYNGNGVGDAGLIAGSDYGHMVSAPPPLAVRDSDIVKPSEMIAMGDANLWAVGSSGTAGS